MRPVGVSPGGRRAGRLLLLMGCLILGVLGLGAVDAHAATPTSLAGETFTSQNVKGSTLTGTCNLEGGSFSFSVSGTAAGPFPGTFTESGTLTALPDGFLTNASDFSSTFTITDTSGAVIVTGTKSLDTSSLSSQSIVNCDSADFLRTISGIFASYTATISGTSHDQGVATVNISGLVLPRARPTFSESFGSAGAPPPVSKAQCKQGGWISFGTLFKNQGDCVSFVATGGKNPATG